MSRIRITPENRVMHDPKSAAIRAWFDTPGQSMAKAPFAPREVAHQVLKESADLFKIQPDLQDLRDRAVINGEDAHSVRLTQEFKGVPVDASEVVVNMSADGRVYSIYNNYHYDIPKDLNPKKVKVPVERAKELVDNLLRVYEDHEVREPELIVYQYQRIENHPPKPPGKPAEHRQAFLTAADKLLAEAEAAGDAPVEGQYYLVWSFVATTRAPAGSWRILVDAMTGRLIQAIDLAQYLTGSGRVFDPNPVVTTGNATLAPSTPSATLDAMTNAVVMDHLNPPDGSGNLHLDGSFVQMEEIEAPTFAEPTSSLGDFIVSTGNRSFLDGMCYFHLDRFQNYIQTVLGLSNVANFPIGVDPQGVNGDDNSHYLPGTKKITFGEGGGVPDAQDAMVILHEYGHAIQDNVNPGFDNPQSGLGEGFGDFLAAVFYDDKHANPAATRGWMMSWDARGGWGGRRYDRAYNFDDPQYTTQLDNHLTGELWCSVMFELYRKLGGDSQWYPAVRLGARDLSIRLHLMANFHVPSAGAQAMQMAHEIEAADSKLGGWNGLADGLHKKVIYDTFSRRHLDSYPAKTIDVYINDGRNGGYGSTSGNDLFTEVLWQDNYWETQDIWVKTSPYATAADQQAGGPGDHVEPPVNSPAYLYVRIKNRGTDAAGSGPVTVRAFHCNPGIGLVWPDDWTEMDASAAIPVNNVLPGVGNGIIAGPFKWTPTQVGHECVLVIAECANDRAITQDLAATAHVRHSDLVPFDNNIAQRNLVPTAAKGRKVRQFWLRNPDEAVRTIDLHFTSTLPQGWRWLTNLVSTREIRLAPFERKLVDLIIDQGDGQEVTHFDDPPKLVVTGTIDGKLIGGMTFYAAPPSAFGEPRKADDKLVASGGSEQPSRINGEVVRATDLAGLSIPWQECEVEGEIEIKIRFRK
jgi:zinc metalloprotease ZmpB